MRVTSEEYAKKLLDPRWQRLRLEVFQRDNFTCVSCGRMDRPLNVHHIVYLKGLEPWEYSKESLITYCDLCHESDHLIGNQLNEYLLDIIKRKPLLAKPLAECCILGEHHEPFNAALRDFLKGQMIDYLKTKNGNANG